MNNQQKLPRIFFIPGLGADKRAFSNLQIKTSLQQVHIDWLKPEKRESLTAYCRRLAEKYKINDGDILIGLSSDFIIHGGSHFLTWENAEDVAAIIRRLMKEKGLNRGK